MRVFMSFLLRDVRSPGLVCGSRVHAVDAGRMRRPPGWGCRASSREASSAESLRDGRRDPGAEMYRCAPRVVEHFGGGTSPAPRARSTGARHGQATTGPARRQEAGEHPGPTGDPGMPAGRAAGPAPAVLGRPVRSAPHRGPVHAAPGPGPPTRTGRQARSDLRVRPGRQTRPDLADQPGRSAWSGAAAGCGPPVRIGTLADRRRPFWIRARGRCGQRQV